MSSLDKNLLVAGFTLALLIVGSHCDSEDCVLTTSTKCKYNDMCVATCLQRAGGYTGGHCSTAFLYCVCVKPCAAKPMMTAAPVEKQLAGNGDGGRMGMAS